MNSLFGTDFGVMSEEDRRQTTKGIWLSKNMNNDDKHMADNILVMDIEGTDGRERGEDQDFERKAALFALATSEVLIVNMWETQVGLYQGANMGLLKTVFEVNLQLFLKDKKFVSSSILPVWPAPNNYHRSVPRSLLFFVIRDHLGQTPLANLRKTIVSDLSRIWSSLSRPPGLEDSKIDDYFDFAFVALPHKVLQPEKFVSDVRRLGTRFRDGYKDPRTKAFKADDDSEGVFLPEYHRRIPADGFSMYASSIWDQIVDNKDLDLPTQQELLAQFRCDEIAREVLIGFDEKIAPLESKQAENAKLGKPALLPGLGEALKFARITILRAFQAEASRYHKAVFTRKRDELQSNVDSRLKALFQGQLAAAHKLGVTNFGEAVSEAVRQGQKRGSNYDFAQIVETEKQKALKSYETEAQVLAVEGAPWSDYRQEISLYRRELNEASARLRKDEMRRLAARVERWVKTQLAERVGLEFNSLGSGRRGTEDTEGSKPVSEKDFWDRIWDGFVEVVKHAEKRFTERARGFDASSEEVDAGLWRLRRKSWTALRTKLDEEVREGNILLKLRENFEDKFRYDAEGVPRIWRPTDDIEGIYTGARQSTLTLIPIISHFKLSRTSAPPPLESWVGQPPSSVSPADEEDLAPIGGVDEDSGISLEEENTILTDGKASELAARFKKTADGVYVEAKRSAIGGVTQVPLYFYGLLLALGWNEIVAVLRNPAYFILLAFVLVGGYVTYTLNLWGPMLRMGDAASNQAIQIAKEKLREFLESQEGSGAQRVPMTMRGRGDVDEVEEIEMKRRDVKAKDEREEDDG